MVKSVAQTAYCMWCGAGGRRYMLAKFMTYIDIVV